MKLELSEKKIKNFPTQAIATGDGVVLKRGMLLLEIKGEQSFDIIQAVFGLTSESGSTREEIVGAFPKGLQGPINDLVDSLLQKRILYETGTENLAPLPDEDHMDILYWNFSVTKTNVEEEFSKYHFALVGVNLITRRIAEALLAGGVKNFTVVDFVALRNASMYADDHSLLEQAWPAHLPEIHNYADWAGSLESNKPSCIIAASEFGDWHHLSEWNNYCVEEKIHYFPVLLHDMRGYVGPIVIPGETACFECMRTRRYSNMAGFEASRSVENNAFYGRSITGMHPSMANVLGDVASIELFKFYGKAFQTWKVGSVIDINLINSEMKSRKVLKLPRCKTCSTLKYVGEKTTLDVDFIQSRDYIR